MPLSHRFQRDILPVLATVACVVLFCSMAHAAGADFEASSEGLIVKCARWYQRISIPLLFVAWIGNGLNRVRPGKAEAAREFMWDHLVPGSVVVVSGVAIAQWIKVTMGATSI